MAGSAKIIALTALTLMLAPAARAQDAKPDRCEGTLCDLYYSGKGEPAKTSATQTSAPAGATGSMPAGATPVTVPSTGGLLNFFKPSTAKLPESPPATSTNSYMHLGGGGLLGGSGEPCSGTLCDLYHGTTSTSGQQEASAAGATPIATPEPQVPHRHIVHESETRPKCSSPSADPWRCFR